MTVALDTSALLAIAVDGSQRAIVLDALDGDPLWSASALALTEALPAIDRLTDEAVLRLDLEDAIRLAWDHLHVVPVDQRCLDRAAGLAREQPVRAGYLRAQLRAAERSRLGTLKALEAKPLDPETQNQLKALGYLR